MLNKQQELWFKTLTQIDGVSGHEQNVAHYLKTEYEKMGFEVLYDQLGSIVCHKPSTVKHAPKVLILGHMDEVGFLVKDITDTGVLKIHPVGGWFSQNLLAQRVRVTTRLGTVYPGTIGSVPPHLLSPEKRLKPIQIEDMIVDIGATSLEDVKRLGVQIGDMVVLDGEFLQLAGGDRYLSKAFDNRYGCVMGLDLLNHFKDESLPFDLYVGASVQEEVGLRGAQTITQMIQPDYAIVLDCSPANDATDKTALGRLGDGILVRVMDSGMIASKDLIYELVDTCVKHDIKHQYYISPGGTDAGIVHKSNGGVKTVTCCIVARNIHTCSSIMDSNDYQSAKQAIEKMLVERNW